MYGYAFDVEDTMNFLFSVNKSYRRGLINHLSIVKNGVWVPNIPLTERFLEASNHGSNKWRSVTKSIMNQEKEQGFPNYRVSICSLTKVAPSVSFTPHEEEDDYLVAATDKYDICCDRDSDVYLKISEKGSTLAKHKIDGGV
jgi:hypothetical protein